MNSRPPCRNNHDFYNGGLIGNSWETVASAADVAVRAVARWGEKNAACAPRFATASNTFVSHRAPAIHHHHLAGYQCGPESQEGNGVGYILRGRRPAHRSDLHGLFHMIHVIGQPASQDGSRSNRIDPNFWRKG